MRGTNMRNSIYLAGALVLAFSGGVAANNSSDPDLAGIRAQQTELRAQAVAGTGPFQDVSEVRRNEMVARQDRLLHLLDGKDEFDDLTQKQKLEAFNTLEWLNSAINGTEPDRMVCEMVRKTGSNRRERVGKTVAQRNQERSESEEYLRREFQRGFVPPSN
jgi:hypothetical protein